MQWLVSVNRANNPEFTQCQNAPDLYDFINSTNWNQLYAIIITLFMRSESHRKGSYQASSQSEDDVGFMFPKISASDLRASLQSLKENYVKSAHASLLINYCYRCHNIAFVQAYEQFRQIEHPELEQQKISNLYDNSAFVDLKELSRRIQKQNFEIPGPHIAPVPKTLCSLLDSIFQKYGYIPNLERFLLYYPTYLEKHILTERELFQNDQIDSKVAYFLAICAAAEMGSAYIIARMIRKFLKEGGSIQWLKQGKYPPKLKLVLVLNRLMARAPWQITSDTISQILQSSTIHWAQKDLAICIQIMCFSHQLCTIALGVGLCTQQPELLNHLNLQQLIEMKNQFDSKIYQNQGEEKEKLAVMIPVIKEMDQYEDNDRLAEFKEERVMSKKMIKKSMRRSQNVDPYMKEIGNELTKQEMYRQINKWVGVLLPEYHIIQKRGEMRNNVMDYSQYNYKFMAYPILHNLTQGMADKIQGIISYSQIMTRGKQKIQIVSFGSQKLNHTKQFRRAVRYYAQNLCGYTHHEYDFKNNVGSILTMTLKFYIRLLTLSPLHITPQVIRETNHQSGQIQCFDLGHLAILIGNTKMSLALTMAIQAFEL